MRSELFEHELMNTAAVFGRHSTVRVVCQGEHAYTDGETIVLPSLAGGVEMDPTTAMITRGYLDHEAGHIRHTDMERSKAFMEEALAKGRKRVKEIWNALEDVWLERRVVKEYPGALKNLRETARAVDREFLDTYDPETWPGSGEDGFLAAVAITWEGRKGYGHDTGGECLKHATPFVQGRVGDWVGALDKCASTADVIALAEKIDAELDARAGCRPPPPPPPVGPGRPDEECEGGGGKAEGPTEREGKGEGPEPDGCKGEAEGEEGSRGEGEAREAGSREEGEGESRGEASAREETSTDEIVNGEGAVEGVKEDAGEGGGFGSGAGTRAGVSDEVYKLPDMAEVMKKHLLNAGATPDFALRGKYRPWSKAHDKWHHRTDKTGKYGGWTYGKQMKRGTAEEYDRIKATYLAGQLNVMRRKLERALAAKQRRDWQGGYEYGRLDTKRLVGAFRGQPNVFKMREDEEDLDTAVSILVDMSGSMSGGYPSKSATARIVTIALAETLDRVGVAFAVTGFNARSGYLAMAGKSGDDLMNEAKAACAVRHEPLDLYEFKRFDEPLRAAKGAITTLPGLTDGNNVDGESILYAYGKLAERTERRKVILTLSDGAPAFYGAHDYTVRPVGKPGEQHLRDVVDWVGKQGVDCVGIGIQSDAVQHFYPRWAVVHSVEDLAGATIETLARLLVNERYVADNSKLMKTGGTV